MHIDGKVHLICLKTGHNQDSFHIFADTDSLQDFDWFSNYISIYFSYDNQLILVRRGIVGVELEHLQRNLENLVAGTISVYKSDAEYDLGLMWNNHWQNIALAESALQTVNTWDSFGSQFLFLQCNSNGMLSNNTFLYQDERNQYVLQISSCYPYFFVLSDSIFTYDQWLPCYTILYRQNITLIILRQWIMQLKKLCVYYRRHYHENYHQEVEL
jgi:hypothetical protein